MEFKICEFCGKEHDGSYGSGRFCSPTCSRKYSYTYVSDEGRQNQIKALTDPGNRKLAHEKSKETSRAKKEERQLTMYTEKIDYVGENNNTMRVGKLGELATAKKFLEHGIDVYVPIVDTSRVDMVAEFGGKLQKIQVKASGRLTGSTNGSTQFRLTSAGNKFNHGMLTAKKHRYTIDEVDYFALYDCNEDDVYLLKNDGIKDTFSIRHIEAVPGQKVNYDYDYQIDHVLDLIAQGLDPESVIGIINEEDN